MLRLELFPFLDASVSASRSDRPEGAAALPGAGLWPCLAPGQSPDVCCAGGAVFDRNNIWEACLPGGTDARASMRDIPALVNVSLETMTILSDYIVRNGAAAAAVLRRIADGRLVHAFGLARLWPLGDIA